MKNVIPVRRFAFLATALAFPTLAHAHSGDALAFDCASGLAHPFHGLDHLLATIAVGFFAAQLGGRARWVLPATFLGAMSGAAALGTRGIFPAGVEAMIATSVLALGLLIAAAARPPLAINAALVGIFAVAHGLAHGAEIPAGSGALSYGAGLMISTAVLQAAGVFLGHHANLNSSPMTRRAGVAFAAAGAVLLFI